MACIYLEDDLETELIIWAFETITDSLVSYQIMHSFSRSMPKLTAALG